MSLDALLGWRFGRDIGLVRAVTAHLLRTEAGLPAQEAGRILGRSRQTVHNLTTKLSHPASERVTAPLIRRVHQLLYPPVLITLESIAGPLRRLPPRLSVHRLHGLVECRIAAGLTQAELAARAGIARETLIRIERGRPATIESMEKLERALQIAVSVLVEAPNVPDQPDCGVTKTKGPVTEVSSFSGRPRTWQTCPAVTRCMSCLAWLAAALLLG